LHEITQGQVISIGQKQMRSSRDHRRVQPALYMVNAFAVENHLMLGSCQVEYKSSQITAIPALLCLLAIQG
jgi:hypothetical protein